MFFRGNFLELRVSEQRLASSAPDTPALYLLRVLSLTRALGTNRSNDLGVPVFHSSPWPL